MMLKLTTASILSAVSVNGGDDTPKWYEKDRYNEPPTSSCGRPSIAKQIRTNYAARNEPTDQWYEKYQVTSDKPCNPSIALPNRSGTVAVSRPLLPTRRKLKKDSFTSTNKKENKGSMTWREHIEVLSTRKEPIVEE